MHCTVPVHPSSRAAPAQSHSHPCHALLAKHSGLSTVLASGMWTECTFGSGPHFASVLSHLGGSGHQNEIPCTHPPSPNPCDSEYDHFGACRTVSEAIGGLGRASPQGADAGEPLAIFLPFWDFWTIFRHFWEM